MIYTLDTIYKSKPYEKFRNITINERLNSNGESVCECCGKVIVNQYDTILHHKIELTEQTVNDYSISLNPDNVQIICFKCHNQKHRRFGEEAKKKVYIVYGAPCSGKSTWVSDVAGPNDLIIDMDSIYQCISINDRYTKPDRLKSTVFEIRDKMLDIVKYRSGKWQDAYVIGGYPLHMDRERLEIRLNASSIFIDTDKSECLRRLANRDSPYKIIEQWQSYIENWFDSYQK